MAHRRKGRVIRKVTWANNASKLAVKLVTYRKAPGSGALHPRDRKAARLLKWGS